MFAHLKNTPFASKQLRDQAFHAARGQIQRAVRDALREQGLAESDVAEFSQAAPDLFANQVRQDQRTRQVRGRDRVVNREGREQVESREFTADEMAREMGVDCFMRGLEGALRDGLQLIQVREKSMPPDDVKALAAAVVKRAKRFGAKVLINSDLELAQEVGAEGVHLNSGQLMACATRPPLELIGASCHDARELEQAERLGADFVVLGPVQATATHPEAIPLGWEQFARLIERYSLPAYALGGLSPLDLQTAWTCGAHGIAMQRGAWLQSGFIGAPAR